MNANARENDISRPVLPPDAPRVRLSASTPDGTSSCETDRPVTVIGSRRDCHLALLHADVSRTHCAVINTGLTILVRDLLSRSGTFINDRLVRTAVVTPGDVLRAGPVNIGVGFPGSPGESRADAPNEPAPTTSVASLVVEVAGHRLDIGQNPAVIGRRNAADVLIDSPDVSLAHALLFGLEGRPVVCDLGSRSGTLVNGQRAEELCWLNDGDELNIGGEKLRVRRDCPAPVAAPAAAAGHAGEAVAPSSSPPAPVAALAGKLPVAPGEPPGSDSVSRSSPPRVSLPASLADLADLEQTIAAVQSQITAARARIEDRKQQLDERERELERRIGELQSRQDALQQAEARFAERQAATCAREQACAQKLASALEREQALEQHQAEMTEAQVALELRRAELGQLAADLDEQRQRLETQQAALSAELAGVQESRHAVEQQAQALKEAAAAACQKEEELGRRQAETEAAAAQLAQDREKLAADGADLAARVAQHAEAVAALERRTEEITDREATIASRACELEERDAALRGRELRETETFEKIGQLKSVLHRASAMFATTGASDAGSAKQSETAPEPGVAAAAPRDGASRRAASEAQRSDAGSNELPAPMVDQPIFGAGAAVLPVDWLPELRERFRVLRRVSSKSSQELIAQVSAEHARSLQDRGPGDPPPRKKSRFPWGH